MKTSLSIILLFTLLIINTIYSQINFWEKTNGTEDGHVNDLYSASDGKVYAGTMGVYQSSNNGNSWSYIGFGNNNVSAIAVSQSGIIYAGTDNINNVLSSGIYVSTNSGNNWNATALQNCLINDIQISSTGAVFATTSYPVRACYKSTDNGNSWLISFEGYPTEISVSPNNNIFIALWDGGIAKSTNDGFSWQIISNPLIGALNTIDASVSGYIFIGSRTGALCRSTDDGISWQELNYPNIYKVEKVKALANGNVFAGTIYEGIWHSSNFGNSWEGYWAPDSNMHDVSCIGKTLNNSVLTGFLLGTIFKTSNYGALWQESVIGLRAGLVNSILKTSSGKLLAGSFSGLHYSSDNGLNWSRRTIGYKQIFACIENNSGILFAFGEGGYKSTDGGQNWTRLNSLGSGIFTALAANNADLFIGYAGGQIFKSTDNGQTWLFNYSNNSSIVSIIKNINGILYAASSTKILKSTDYGFVWNTILTTASDYYNTLAISLDGKIYAGRDSSLIYSADGGNSWQDMNLNKEIESITFDNNGNIIAGTNRDGIFFYNGISWAELNTGLENNFVNSLALNSQGQLLAGTWGTGIYRSIGVIGINPISSEIPSHFSLSQNYPNPFNPDTKIKFSLPSPSEGGAQNVKIIIFDILGHEISTLVNEQLKPGTYEVSWDAANYPSGVYFYKLTTPGYTVSKKMILIK